MNNFEKWRESLTPESCMYEDYTIFKSCKNCPADEFCSNIEGSINCVNPFLKWAESEAD